MGERYIEVFQCSVQDMTWMLATSHANQLAAQQMNQINNNNNTKNNNNNNNYHAKTPSPPPILQTTQAPPMNGLITPPPITTTIYTPTNVSPMQVYGNQFPPMMAQFPPGYLPPPHQMPPHTQALQHPHLPPMMHGQVVRYIFLCVLTYFFLIPTCIIMRIEISNFYFNRHELLNFNKRNNIYNLKFKSVYESF